MQSMSRLSFILSLSILVLCLSLVHSSDVEKGHTSELGKCIDPTTLLIGHQCFLNGKCTCSSQSCKSDSQLCSRFKHSTYNEDGCTDVNGENWPTSCCSDGVCYCAESCDDSNTCDDDGGCPSGLSAGKLAGIAIFIILALIVLGCSCYRIRRRIRANAQRVDNPQPAQNISSVEYVVPHHGAVPVQSGPSDPAVVNHEQLPAYNEAVNIPIAYISK